MRKQLFLLSYLVSLHRFVINVIIGDKLILSHSNDRNISLLYWLLPSPPLVLRNSPLRPHSDSFTIKTKTKTRHTPHAGWQEAAGWLDMAGHWNGVMKKNKQGTRRAKISYAT
jgi:hypothetical protein